MSVNDNNILRNVGYLSIRALRFRAVEDASMYSSSLTQIFTFRIYQFISRTVDGRVNLPLLHYIKIL